MSHAKVFLVAMLLSVPASVAAQDIARVSDEKAVSDADIRVQVEAIHEAYDAAATAGDAAALAALYTEDAKIYPPFSEAVEGRDGIEAFNAEGYAPGFEFRSVVNEVRPLGDGVIDVGSATISAPDGTVLATGKYMSVMVWTDDGLKIRRDMWNFDHGPAGGNDGM